MNTIKNHVQLIGRLGANPEVKVLENGNKLARFSVAVTERFKNKSGDIITDVQWHSVIAWGNLATIAERMLYKGSQVTVDGKLVNRSYTNKEGEERNTTEVVANELFVYHKQSA
jgi:single-strand DNA-binding protein